MPPKHNHRHNTQSTVRDRNELLSQPPGEILSSRMATRGETSTILKSPSQMNRRVFYHREEEDLVYRDSSIPVSSHRTSNASEIRSSSRPMSIQARTPGPSNQNDHIPNPIFEGDDGIDDQQSTEPIPVDFDPLGDFASSPSSCIHLDVPVTRARARARARALVTHSQIENENPVGSSHEIKDSNSETRGKESRHQVPLILHDSPASRPGEQARPNYINGFDGSAEGQSPAGDSVSTGTGPEVGTSKPDQNDDEYELPVSETENDSEESIIREIRCPPKKTAKKNVSSSTPASKPKGKHATVASGSSTIRRPKKPFYTDDSTGKASTAASAVSSHADRQPRQKQRKKGSDCPDDTKQQECKPVQTTAPKKRTAVGIPQTQTKRHKATKAAAPVASNESDRSTGHNQKNTVPEKVTISSDTPFSEENISFSDVEDGHIPLQFSSPHHSDIYIPEASKPRVTTPETEIILEKVPNKTDVCTQTDLAPLSSSPVSYDNVIETKNKETQTDHVEIRSFSHKLHPEEPINLVTFSDSIHKLLRSPGVHGNTSKSRVAESDSVREDREKKGRSKLVSPEKTVIYPSSREESLHPTSRVWAQGVTEKSRQKSLVSMPSKPTEEAEPLGRTPTMMQDPHKHSISKREAALEGRRDAIFESLHEITTAVVQHLQSKESAIDDIIGSYRRNGQAMINTLLDRQATEFSHVVSAFDSNCVQLGKIFQESAHHAKMIERRSFSKNNRNFKDWARRRAELEEAIEVTNEASAST
ncbi:hypothetical protein F4777DRAFT_231167 [Nemania sp. FL0916]|nr:hypothetical protein F4777DRAFT_231167 [Nemania sp. FL0916]